MPAEFHQRLAGESKLDAQVMLQFGGLLLDKTFAGYLPLRFVSFAAVGAIGVMVHLVVWACCARSTVLGFGAEQTIATLVAMMFNFELNNAITYGPAAEGTQAVARLAVVHGGVRRRRGGQYRHREVAVLNSHTAWSIAGAMGAVIGVVWNYAVSATLVWRAR